MPSPRSSPRISWERVRAIFGSPPAPETVTERQFDGFDEDLARMARTPWEEFEFSDLGYYHQDLAYVDLQPDLFAYLFPVCLMDWHASLLENESCLHSDTDFLTGMHRGRILEKMLTSDQKRQVCDFFRDGLMDRLELERGFDCKGSHAPAHGWYTGMNALGLVVPNLGSLWDEWWALSSPGSAVAWLQYASGLMYAKGENPLFGEWTREEGGGGPYLWENNSFIHDAGWLPENVSELKRRLTPETVTSLVLRAAKRLGGEAEEEMAKRVAADLPTRMDRVRRRCLELPGLLARSELTLGWSD